ncbi:hypothetical protein [Streptomyces sp. NPDC090025]|uniref:pPIWI_RE_Z domain-containing protein n=1 Tax=Streptomyces sp. NPDC090025 TaxID=3365922 RepID=UPI0038366FC0
MRSFARHLSDGVLQQLSAHAGPAVRKPALEPLCQTEIGLRLQQRLMPGAPAAQAWVLFSGYGFAVAGGVTRSADDEAMLRAGRYTMWPLRRRRAWREALLGYQRFDPALRGFDVPDPDQAPEERPLTVAPGRWEAYDELLRCAPPFAGDPMRPAGPGPHAFPVSRTLAVVELPDLPVAPPLAHDIDRLPPGNGEPLRFTMEELRQTAAEMDATAHRSWTRRLDQLVLTVGTSEGFVESDTFTIDRIQHLLGIVGSGKSTLRDIVTVHLAVRHRKRVTVVVNDVAEVLKLVELYNTYTDGAAAPVLGAAGKERHAQRLHRRLAGRGEHRLLAHTDPGFAHLSTACVINGLRHESSGAAPLQFGEAPCARLRPPAWSTTDESSRHERWQKHSRSCPFWGSCGRHHASRELVSADIWVATMASLLDSSPPRPQNGERLRYLELACRRSDLIVVDEADRVQMQLDQAFAPAVLLAGGDEDGFIDKLTGHKTRELSVAGRIQLSDRDVEVFTAALNTVAAATDRLYAMLVADHALRNWVRTGYFSAWILQLGLLDERYPLPASPEKIDAAGPARERLGRKLDAFRDNPFGDRPRLTDETFTELTRLLTELLHTANPEMTHGHAAELMDDTFDMSPLMEAKQTEFADAMKAYEKALAQWESEVKVRRGQGRRAPRKPRKPQHPADWHDELVTRFEFTLLLCALEPKLALINTMWPRVEAALNLAFNTMYRRPDDYAPMVPEAPMGNLLGFQFKVEGPDEGGVRSGELTFFRCSGVGRELLRTMPDLAAVDGRPGAHVLLMSGSSWAGRSSRYHIPVDVGMIIHPQPEAVERIGNESEMRLELIKPGEAALRVSGTPVGERPDVLCRMVEWLGASWELEEHGGPLERELLELPPERRHILLLVGSYEEARIVADTLHHLNPRWRDKVLRLVSDDEALDDETGASSARTLRRGDVEHLKDCGADVLVAPLLAVERGHNILNASEEAAIGTVYFLARPNPRPDDLGLAVHAINDWIVRAQESGAFARWVRSGDTLEEGAETVRAQARSRWSTVLQRSMAWSRLGEDREQVTWDMLVLIWQVIGRLVRGGVPARVVFVDAAFAPNQAAEPPAPDTPESSLLHSIVDVLAPYFDAGSDHRERDRSIVRALYGPLWQMLNRCLRPSAPAPPDQPVPPAVPGLGDTTCTE